jgi:hypothetical protein
MIKGEQELKFNYDDATRKQLKDFIDTKMPAMDLNKNLLNDLDEATEQVRNELLLLQRLYQISPTAQALKVLKDDLKFISASQVVAYPKDVFVQMIKDKLNEEEALAIHARAGYINARTDMISVVINNIHNGLYPQGVLPADSRANIIDQLKQKIKGYGKLFDAAG